MSRFGVDGAERVRNLVALDAENLMKRLRSRRAEMITLFSRRRDREVLLAALNSWFEEADASYLVHLRPEQQSALSAFYEAVAELRFYFQYTEDMPGTVERTTDKHIATLEGHYARLVKAFGGPVPVDIEDLKDASPKEPEPQPPIIEATATEKPPAKD